MYYTYIRSPNFDIIVSVDDLASEYPLMAIGKYGAGYKVIHFYFQVTQVHLNFDYLLSLDDIIRYGGRDLKNIEVPAATLLFI